MVLAQSLHWLGPWGRFFGLLDLRKSCKLAFCRPAFAGQLLIAKFMADKSIWKRKELHMVLCLELRLFFLTMIFLTITRLAKFMGLLSASSIQD